MMHTAIVIIDRMLVSEDSARLWHLLDAVCPADWGFDNDNLHATAATHCGFIFKGICFQVLSSDHFHRDVKKELERINDQFVPRYKSAKVIL